MKFLYIIICILIAVAATEAGYILGTWDRSSESQRIERLENQMSLIISKAGKEKR
jgi:hypothetical protein